MLDFWFRKRPPDSEPPFPVLSDCDDEQYRRLSETGPLELFKPSEQRRRAGKQLSAGELYYLRKMLRGWYRDRIIGRFLLAVVGFLAFIVSTGADLSHFLHLIGLHP